MVVSVTDAWLALRGRLPLRLMRFLNDAHRRGVLRQSGTTYQSATNACATTSRSRLALTLASSEPHNSGPSAVLGARVPEQDCGRSHLWELACPNSYKLANGYFIDTAHKPAVTKPSATMMSY